MNIYRVSKNVFRFRIWNLNADRFGLAGHFTIWWHKPSGSYILGQHGGFGGLTWYPEMELKPAKPTEAQVGFLKDIIAKELEYACFYDGEKIHGQGEYLLESTRKRQAAGEYISHCGRLIFSADSPLTRLPHEKGTDDEAVKMLESRSGEMADTLDSKSSGLTTRAGSIPVSGTNKDADA